MGNSVIDLVGANSAYVTDADTTNRVRVESAPIKVTQVAGLVDDVAGYTIGNYGYWVGDEGVKANIALVDPWPAASTTATPEEKRYSFINAQRSGIERVTGDAGVALDSVYQGNSSALGKVLSMNQLSLIGEDPTVLGNLDSRSKCDMSDGWDIFN